MKRNRLFFRGFPGIDWHKASTALLLGLSLCLPGTAQAAGTADFSERTREEYVFSMGDDVTYDNLGIEYMDGVDGAFVLTGQVSSFTYTFPEDEDLTLIIRPVSPGLVIHTDLCRNLNTGRTEKTAEMDSPYGQVLTWQGMAGEAYTLRLTALAGAGEYTLRLVHQPAAEQAGSAANIRAVLNSPLEILRFTWQAEAGGCYLLQSDIPEDTVLFAWEEESGAFLGTTLGEDGTAEDGLALRMEAGHQYRMALASLGGYGAVGITAGFLGEEAPEGISAQAEQGQERQEQRDPDPSETAQTDPAQGRIPATEVTAGEEFPPGLYLLVSDDLYEGKLYGTQPSEGFDLRFLNLSAGEQVFLEKCHLADIGRAVPAEGEEAAAEWAWALSEEQEALLPYLLLHSSLQETGSTPDYVIGAHQVMRFLLHGEEDGSRTVTLTGAPGLRLYLFRMSDGQLMAEDEAGQLAAHIRADGDYHLCVVSGEEGGSFSLNWEEAAGEVPEAENAGSGYHEDILLGGTDIAPGWHLLVQDFSYSAVYACTDEACTQVAWDRQQFDILPVEVKDGLYYDIIGAAFVPLAGEE